MRKTLVLIGLILCSAFGVQAQTSVALSPVPAQQFFSQAGVPLASGCIYTYITGTSTPLATYTDGTGIPQNTNPVILDGGGFGNIWLSNSSYRFTIYSRGIGGVQGTDCFSGVFQRTVDNVSAYTVINQAQNIFLLGASSDPGGSAGELAYRTDIPCFRGFTTLWDCFVTLTAVQTLTNKTLTSPTITTPAITTPTITNPSINAVSIINGPATYVVLTNDGATGTAINRIAKLNGANPSAAITVSGVDTSGAIGICVSGCANSGSSTIQQSGTVLCTFDVAGATAGDYVQISASVSGSCHDAGASYPTSGQVIGRALATGAGGVNINLFGPEIRGGNSQGVMQSGAYSNATTTFSDITGLSFTAAANTNYRMTCDILFQGSATTAGPKLQFTGPAGATVAQVSVDGGTNATTYGNTFVSGFSVGNTALGVLGAGGVNLTAHVSLGLRNGVSAGLVQLQAAANGAGTLTIFAGSACTIQGTN